MPLVTGLDFVFLMSTDFARSKRFFEEVLELEVDKTYDMLPGGEWRVGPETTIQVLEAAAIGRPFQANGVIALRVDDVAAARATLEERGVEFLADTMDSGVCHQAFFSDPDGNTFALHHRYAPPGARPGDPS